MKRYLVLLTERQIKALAELNDLVPHLDQHGYETLRSIVKQVKVAPIVDTKDWKIYQEAADCMLCGDKQDMEILGKAGGAAAQRFADAFNTAVQNKG